MGTLLRLLAGAALAGALVACPGEPAEAPATAAVQPVAEAAFDAVRARLVAGAEVPTHPTAWGSAQQGALLDRARTLLPLVGHRPDDIELLLELADIYRRALFSDRSLRLVGLALRARPEDPDALFEGALGLLERQEPAAAAALLAGVVEREPSHLAALRAHARVLRRLGDGAGARRAARAGLELNPFDGELKLLLGLLALDAGAAEEAEPLLAVAARSLPESLEAHYAHVAALRELGRDEEADAQAAVHARLARIDDLGLPPGVSAHDRSLALARADVEAGVLERAEAELRALLGRERSPAALALLEELWRARGEDVEARRAAFDD